MGDVGVDHGYGHYFRDKVQGSSYTGGIGVGTFSPIAESVTTVTDAGVTSASEIMIFPLNGPAGELLRLKSCFVTPGNGSFTFNVSASGSGSPDAAESFAYMFLTEG